MPALLFILPMEIVGIFTAAWLKYGRSGILMLIYFDEEQAIKSGGQSAVLNDQTKLPLH